MFRGDPLLAVGQQVTGLGELRPGLAQQPERLEAGIAVSGPVLAAL